MLPKLVFSDIGFADPILPKRRGCRVLGSLYTIPGTHYSGTGKIRGCQVPNEPSIHVTEKQEGTGLPGAPVSILRPGFNGTDCRVPAESRATGKLSWAPLASSRRIQTGCLPWTRASSSHGSLSKQWATMGSIIGPTGKQKFET